MNRWVLLLVAGLCCGCWDAFEKQVKKDPNSIIGKKTQDIGEFDPKAGEQVSDSKIKADSPVLYGAQAYVPMIEKTSKLQIEHAVNLFHAAEGRYPKDYEEFMQRIIKENNIRLPQLPRDRRYQYDVANHQLEIVVSAPAPAEMP